MKYGMLNHFWGNVWKCDYIETAKKIRNAGFDVMEIGANHLYDMTDAEINALKDVSKGLGLELSTNIGPSKDYDLASPDAGVRAAGVAYIQRLIEKMSRVGSRALGGAMYSYWPCSFDYINKEQAWEDSIAGMKEVAKAAEEYDVVCSLEVLNRFETYIMTDCKEGLEYLDRVGSDHIKLLLDTFHMNIEEDSLPGAIRLAGDKLGHLHLGEGNRKLPGLGSLPWMEIGQALRDINYQEYAVIEPFMRWGGEIGPVIHIWRDLSEGATTEEEMTEQAKISLAFLKKNFEG
ncbi:MAG: sugar phosphate isomerase/epimerase family protein [Eubacteriales bacterium]|nr:sugar phosphate isomerase/epimerase family protein [Eubacteriales bacterium]